MTFTTSYNPYYLGPCYDSERGNYRLYQFPFPYTSPEEENLLRTRYQVETYDELAQHLSMMRTSPNYLLKKLPNPDLSKTELLRSAVQRSDRLSTQYLLTKKVSLSEKQFNELNLKEQRFLIRCQKEQQNPNYYKIAEAIDRALKQNSAPTLSSEQKAEIHRLKTTYQQDAEFCCFLDKETEKREPNPIPIDMPSDVIGIITDYLVKNEDASH